jgi:hypothetical protein
MGTIALCVRSNCKIRRARLYICHNSMQSTVKYKVKKTVFTFNKTSNTYYTYEQKILVSLQKTLWMLLETVRRVLRAYMHPPTDLYRLHPTSSVGYLLSRIRRSFLRVQFRRKIVSIVYKIRHLRAARKNSCTCAFRSTTRLIAGLLLLCKINKM